MIEIRLLGSIDLRAPSKRRDPSSVLSQPKRVAFLAYLALAGRGRCVRRDTLLGVFWPESSEERARNSLNQMVFALRRALGSEVVVTRGADEVGLEPDAAWCDAAAFESALDAGDKRHALEFYGGDLLPGLHVSDNVEFERWLAEERERLRRRAMEAAVSFAEEELEVNPADAVHWLRRASAWDPYDERVLRRLMLVLDALGDRSGAVREFESFRGRLSAELELEPSPETRNLAEEIRTREDAREDLPESPVRVARPVLRWAERRRRRPIGAVVLVGAIVLVALGLWLRGSSQTPAAAALDQRRVLVATFENRTGDSELDAIGFMAGDWITQGLARSGLVRVVPFSTVMRETPYLEDDMRRLASDMGAGLMVAGAFYGRGDSILFQPRVVDVATGEVIRAIDVVAGPAGDPAPAVNELRARVLGALGGLMDERLVSWGDPASQPPTLEAYRDMAEGFDLFQRAERHRPPPGMPSSAEHERLHLEAAARFVRAGESDPAFVAPLLWAVWAYGNAGRWATADSLLATLENREGLSSWDQTVLQLQRATMRGDYDREYEIAQRLVELSPDSEWLFKLGTAAYQSRRYRAAIEAFTRLDPDRGWIAGWPGHWRLRIEARHALGDHERELEDVGRLRERFPEDPALPVLELSALAALGRANQVVARVEAGLARDEEWSLASLDQITGELRAHGAPEAASRLVERGITIESARPEDEARNRRLATFLYVTGRLGEARALLRRLADEHPDDQRLRVALGVIAARFGDRAEAERADRWLANRNPALGQDRAWITLHRARIAAQLGDRERAVDLVEEALDEGLRSSHQPLHLLIDLQPLHGEPRFQALLRSRD